MMERTPWDDCLALEQVDVARFRARVDERWASLQGVHGGVVAAVAVAAAETALRSEGLDATSSLRAATFGYASGNVAGEFEIDVEVVRRGRAMVTTHTRTTQAGKTTTVGRLHHSTPWDGPAFSDVAAMPTRPAGRELVPLAGNVAHLRNVETYLHPDTTPFAGAARAEWIAWNRPRHGGTFDATWLTMFGDFFPPAVFARTSGPQRAVTIEYSLQIHSAAGQWTLADDEFLATRVHTFHSHDGFAVEDGWVYLPDGSLLATVRQTRLAGG